MVPKDWLSELESFADILEHLPHQPEASVMYEIMSDALVWSDEVGHQIRGLTWAVRPLFRYRTSMLIGEPDDRFAEEWEAAKRIVPGWIGFRPERCTPSKELKELYLSKCKCCGRKRGGSSGGKDAT